MATTGDQRVANAKMTITDDTWPRHPDGRRKKMGEMTTQQQVAVVRGAVARLTPEFAKEGVALEFHDFHQMEADAKVIDEALARQAKPSDHQS